MKENILRLGLSNIRLKLRVTIGEGATTTVLLAEDVNDSSKKYVVKDLTRMK